MVKNFFAVVGLVLFSSAAFAAEQSLLVSTSRPPLPGPIGICVTDGDFQPHPTDCTRYIRCTHGGIAHDMPCPACNETSRCPEDYLHWNDALETCDWPDVAGCHNTSPVTTTVITNPTTTTVTTNPTTTTTSPPDITTTSDPVTTTTSGPPTTVPCDPRNCNITGTCLTYTYCNRTELDKGPHHNTGNLVTSTCGLSPTGDQLYFNPDKERCDFWSGLDPAWQEEYLKDPKCSICERKSVSPCSADYTYKHEVPGSSPIRWVTDSLTCFPDLIFDEVASTCADPCKVVLKSGATCEAILGLTC